MFDEAVALLESFAERFPEAEMVRDNDCPWELASIHQGRGEFLALLRDRKGAVANYRKALDLYERFRKDYPEDPRCQPDEDGDPPRVKRRIRDVHELLQDIGAGG
jgi:hypothetical protein